jgi:hypothetical protein
MVQFFVRVDKGWEMHIMNTKRILVFGIMSILVLSLSMTIKLVQATEVWSENFDTPILSDWTFFSMIDPQTGPISDGNFSAEGGVLTSKKTDFNFARHNSTVNVGTWSFDIYTPDLSDGYVGVAFLSNGSRPLSEEQTRLMAVEFDIETGTFVWWQIRHDGVMGLETPYYTGGNVDKWHHVEVSRRSNGRFNIYLNGTLIYDMVTNDVTTSLYLECYTQNAIGGAFDNIVVDDEPLPLPTSSPTPTTTQTTQDLTLVLIAVVGGVALVIVLAVVFVKKR